MVDVRLMSAFKADIKRTSTGGEPDNRRGGKGQGIEKEEVGLNSAPSLIGFQYVRLSVYIFITFVAMPSTRSMYTPAGNWLRSMVLTPALSMGEATMRPLKS